MGITKQKPTIKIKNPVSFYEDKFKYLFGHVTSGEHNTDRSKQLSFAMKKLGISEDKIGKGLLLDEFKRAAQLNDNIVKTYTNQYGFHEVRETFFMGPSGKGAVFETTYLVEKDGTRRFVTTIPHTPLNIKPGQ